MLSIFNEELARIEREMSTTNLPNIPMIFRNIPLDEFGKLLLDIPATYPFLKAYFPSMASEEVQTNWTGTHGTALLSQSLAFMKTMAYGYSSITGKGIERAVVLDYGCGWGRLIRLLYKLVPINNIYGVDPWDESINICIRHGVKGNLAISEYVPHSLPFQQKFDLIYAFSVFTHLSKNTIRIVLNTLRKYVYEDGLLVLTIRPKEYWHVHANGSIAPEMIRQHDKSGFAFKPHNRAPINGDITYGDTSMTLSYIKENFPQWSIVAVECNDADPYQVILFLNPLRC